jgi:CRISPR system Cascade subunit CasB
MPESLRIPPQADALARTVTRIAGHSPGDRSVLRHSLGKRPAEVAVGVHRIVVPFLPERASNAAGQSYYDAAERAYYMVAALIASQGRQARGQADAGDVPETVADTATSQDTRDGARESPVRRRNLGYSLAQAAHQGARDKSKNLEDRLELLCRQDIDGLYRHLPRLILQLRADQVRIDWGVLIRDLTRWAADPRQVAKEWAQSFYRASEQITAARKRKNEQDADGHDNEETRS